MKKIFDNSIINKIRKVPIEVKVAVAYVICSVLQKCLSFITLPLFTRLLTKEQYGELTIYQSWSGIISIFMTLNLAYGSFQTAMVKFEDDRDGYISSIEGICLVLFGLVLLVYLPFRNAWNVLFELPTWVMLMLFLEILFTTALQFWSGKKRFEFKYKSVVVITLLISILSAIMAYLFIINSDEKGYARIAGYAFTSIVFGGVLFFVNLIRGKKIYNKVYWKYSLEFNIPLVIYYLSQVIFNQSDRIMISHMVGKESAAVYGVAFSLAIVLIFVINAINNSYVPWFYGKLKNGDAETNKNVSFTIAIIIAILFLGVIWFAPEIILVLAGPQYLEAVYVIPPVSISMLLLFYAQLFVNVEFFYEDKKGLVWASVGSAIINIILNCIYISKYGYIAAAYTTLISYIIFVISNYLTMKNSMKKRQIQDTFFDYKKLILLFIGMCIATAIGSMMYSILWVRVSLAIIMLIVIFIFRKSLIKVFKQISDK